MQHILITHTDVDGWCSAAVILKYIHTLEPDTHVRCFTYSYGSNTAYIAKYIQDLSTDDYRIYMADVTLPDDFMDEYAEHIWHIDHHISRIDEDTPWKARLYREDSAVTVEGYLDISGKQAEQISACELAWLKMFPDQPMPRAVWLMGRYDVWDHNDDVRYLQAYISTRVSSKEYRDKKYLDKWFRDLFTEEGLDRAIQEGREALYWTAKLDAVDCLRTTKIVYMFGKKIALACVHTKGSHYFDQIVEDVPDIEGLLTITYSIVQRVWRCSCYTREGCTTFKALDFIQNFRNVLTGIVSMGGHESACGMSFRGDPREFFDCIQEIVRK